MARKVTMKAALGKDKPADPAREIKVQLPLGMSEDDADRAYEELIAKKRAQQEKDRAEQEAAEARGNDPLSLAFGGSVNPQPETPPAEPPKRRKMVFDGKRPADVPDGATITNGTPAAEPVKSNVRIVSQPIVPVKNETVFVSQPIQPRDGGTVVAAASRESGSTKRGVDPFAPEASLVSSASTAPEVRPGYKLVKAREVLPHVSVYLHPKVIARFKEIAAVEGKKAHAVYLEALDLYLQQNHGVSLEGLSRE